MPKAHAEIPTRPTDALHTCSRDPALCPSEDLTRKIGDTFMGHIAMHTFATVLLLTVHLSHTGRSLRAVRTLRLTIMSHPAGSCSRALPIIPVCVGHRSHS